jgi:hypothetical protein
MRLNGLIDQSLPNAEFEIISNSATVVAVLCARRVA